MKFKFLAVLPLSLISLPGMAQFKSGLGLEFSSFLASPASKKANFSSQAKAGYGISIMKQFSLCKQWGIATGVGLSRFNTSFRYDYPSDVPEVVNGFWNVEAQLNYIRVPVFATYELGLNSKSALNFSAGVNTRILISRQDKQDGNMLWAYVYLGEDYETTPIITPQIAVGYTRSFKNNTDLRLEAFAGQDANNFVNRMWKYRYGPGAGPMSSVGLNLRYSFGKTVKTASKS